MDSMKGNSEAIENASAEKRPTTPVKNGEPVMRSQEDDLSVWQCALRFKRVSLIAMVAAFSASLDGYRKKQFFFLFSTGDILSLKTQRSTSTAVLSPTKVSSSRWHHRAQKSSTANTFQHGEVFSLPVRPWDRLYGFESSVGNMCLDSLTFSQLLQYATERFGRKIALYIIWAVLVIVSIHLAGRALSATKVAN